MVIRSDNVWGKVGGLEAQRADLWVLDMEQVLRGVRQHLAGRLQLPENNSSTHYARMIAFPETRINEYEVKSLNTPKLYPGFDEPTMSVRIDFLVDAARTLIDPASGEVAPNEVVRRSRIFSLLYGWRILTRTGRLPYSSEDIWVPLPPGPIGNLADSFKFDLTVYLLRGVTFDHTDSTGPGLEVSSAYRLKRCWLSSIQLAQLDQSTGNTPLTVQAAIIPEEIYPFDPTGLDAGPSFIPSDIRFQRTAPANLGLDPGLGLV